jgi:hypothetical protein
MLAAVRDDMPPIGDFPWLDCRVRDSVTGRRGVSASGFFLEWAGLALVRGPECGAAAVVNGEGRTEPPPPGVRRVPRGSH